MTPHVVAVVQARMGSTRLPGKVLRPLAGRPMIDWVLDRLGRSRAIGRIVVATSWLDQDDPLVAHGGARDVTVVRGHPTDLLSRYVDALKATDADIIVRITSDCPLIDPGVADDVIDALLASSDADFASNNLPPRTFPRGLDVSAVTRRSLLLADRLDRDPLTREHVTPLLENSSSFNRLAVTSATDHSEVRWTVDTPEDLAAVEAVCTHFQGRDDFDWREALRAWHDHPEWSALNAHVEQKRIEPDPGPGNSQ